LRRNCATSLTKPSQKASQRSPSDCEYPNTRPHCPEVLATKRLEVKEIAVCHFCGACDTKEGAIETGWTPNFWQMFSTGKPAENIVKPVCPKCIAEQLIPSEGEFITKS